MRTIFWISTSVVAVSLLLIIGCDNRSAVTDSNKANDALPAGLILNQAPPAAIDVTTAKQSAKDGDTVVIKGRIGGRVEPIAPNRAILNITDLSLLTCDKSPMPNCATPWDNCCDPPDKIAAASATVQVVDASGQPLKATLKGVGGIEPMMQITARGTVRRIPGSDVIVIDATGIHVGE